jgi:ATP phosphoribosyltransferase regulatory subunit
VHRLLVAHDLGARVRIDLGAIRDFDYYTGVILESYLDRLGRPLVQGGRYDRLLARFGRPGPATGFVIDLDLVGAALRQRVEAPDLTRLDVAVAWTGEGLEPALRLGSTLRLFGLRTVVGTAAQGQMAALGWARRMGARDLLLVGGAGSVVGGAGFVRWIGRKGEARRMSERQVLSELVRSRG